MVQDKCTSTNTGFVARFAAGVVGTNPVHKKFIDNSLRTMNQKTYDDLNRYFLFCLSKGLTLDYLIECYNTITIDTQIEQMNFFRMGTYRHSRFSDVASSVYFNPDYMKKYMYGLAITSFLWPNHASIHEFFVKSFPREKKGVYVEIGPGHGYYFMKAAELGGFSRMIGIDISPSSIEMTSEILRHFLVDKAVKVDLVETDFLDYVPDVGEFGCIVLGEVLEHVEEPAQFLSKIAQISCSETHVYVTTCINAPAVDHIYLYRSPDEVTHMIKAAGLSIVEHFYAPYVGLSFEESLDRKLPINVAYVLRKL